MTTELTAYEHQTYAARNWGALTDAMTCEQDELRWDTAERMAQIPWMDNGLLGKFARLIHMALSDGMKTHETVAEELKQGVKHPYFWDASNRLAAWYDYDEAVFMVLEYNRVRGVQPRKYRPVAFLRKLYQNYYTDYMMEGAKPEDVSVCMTELLPTGEGYTLEVLDTPSDLYHDDRFTHMDSCMIRQPYVYFYDGDSSKVQGVVAYNTAGKAVARCILWTLDDGRRTLDRIYNCDPGGRRTITRWAIKEGILIEPPQDGKVTMPVSTHGYPYLDNFYYGARVNNEIVLFTDPTERSSYLDALEYDENRFIDVDYVHSTSGGNPDWRNPLVEYKGRYVLASHILKDVRNNREVLYSELPEADIHSLHLLDPNTAVKDPSGLLALIYVSDLYGYEGYVYKKQDDDVFIDDCRVPYSSVRSHVHRNDDGEWVATPITDAVVDRRRYRPDRLVRFYGISTAQADMYLMNLAALHRDRIGAVRLYASYITQEDYAEFQQEAQRWYEAL